jgi:DNA repair protein RecN (Recombination protein N)
MEEISRVASGGEISRLMLCIKSLVSDRKGMPTLIFDEIDAGVSGEIADKVGGIMAGLAEGRQVMAITHLPQVASRGSDHFVVFKEDTPDATYTRIRKLRNEERVSEIARMLSGEEVSEEALSNARVLLRVS